MSLFHPALFFLTDLFGGGELDPGHPSLVRRRAAGQLRYPVHSFRAVQPVDRDDSRWMGALGRVLANDEAHVPDVGPLQRRPEDRVLVDDTAHPRAVCQRAGDLGHLFRCLYRDGQNASPSWYTARRQAIVSVWIVHVYAALWVKGTLRAMMRGNVTAGWSWRHHRKWLREQAGGR